jgi:hypothetical protein
LKKLERGLKRKKGTKKKRVTINKNAIKLAKFSSANFQKNYASSVHCTLLRFNVINASEITQSKLHKKSNNAAYTPT